MKKFQHQSLRSLLFSALFLSALTIGVSSCKAWRTITTTSSYVQQTDSATNKTTTTIQTKTVEEYQGHKKN